MKFIPSEALSYPVEVEALFTLARVSGGIGLNAVKALQESKSRRRKEAAPVRKTALECGCLREKVQFAAGDCCHAFRTVSVIS